jgi:hypothetical protein
VLRRKLTCKASSGKVNPSLIVINSYRLDGHTYVYRCEWLWLRTACPLKESDGDNREEKQFMK